jgi:hypothetical protein
MMTGTQAGTQTGAYFYTGFGRLVFRGTGLRLSLDGLPRFFSFHN